MPLSRQAYAATYGLTIGDRIHPGDMGLLNVVTKQQTLRKLRQIIYKYYEFLFHTMA